MKNILQICENNPELLCKLKIKPKSGRPSVTTGQPELLIGIIDIALHWCGAHEKRQADIYCSVKTLDKLTTFCTATINKSFSVGSRASMFYKPG